MTIENYFTILFMARTSGIKAARKLCDSARVNRWADKRYKKTHLLASIKSNPL